MQDSTAREAALEEGREEAAGEERS